MGSVRNIQPAEAVTSAAEIQGPVIVTPFHVQDRETSTVAGAPRAWRRLSQLEAAYENGRLGPKDAHRTRIRMIAGETYTRLWDGSQSAGRDSTQALNAVRGGGNGLPITMSQEAAMRTLGKVESRLGLNDRSIVRSVLGLGYSPAEALRRARLHAETRVTPRFCEALDALAEAIDHMKNGKTYVHNNRR